MRTTTTTAAESLVGIGIGGDAQGKAVTESVQLNLVKLMQ